LQAYYDRALGHLRTADHGRVLDGAGGALAATMIDAYAVADAILADRHRSGAGWTCSDDVLVSDDVDPESVPREIEQGVKERRVVQYDQWKKIDAEEVRRGEEMGKERERMGWDEARKFLTSARVW